MAVFAYTGVDEKGRTVRGTLDADSVKTVRQMLRKKGVFVDEARPLADNPRAARKAARAVGGGNGGGLRKAANTVDAVRALPFFLPSLAAFRRTLKRMASGSVQAVSTMTRQLATLLKAGVPLPESLNALTEQIENEELREALTQVGSRVHEGIAFATTLEDHPKLFPNLYVSMVAAGEASGNLDAVLLRLADFTEGQVKLRNKIVGALAYPAFMLVFGVLIIGVLMVVVVPKVSSIFADFQQAMPWYTTLLINVSHFLGNFWWLVILVVGTAGYFFNRWKNTPEGHYKWDAFILRLPLFGELARMVAISRFTRTLGTLLSSGVPLVKAMDIVKNVLGNKVLEGVVTDATTSIKEGESIAEPLKRSGKFPPLVTHMIAIGERSGELEAMLEAVAGSYDNTIDARVGVLTSLLEPLMIVMLGGSAGGIVFAILMPLLQLNDFVQ